MSLSLQAVCRRNFGCLIIVFSKETSDLSDRICTIDEVFNGGPQ